MHQQGTKNKEYGWVETSAEIAERRGIVVQEYRDRNPLTIAGDCRPILQGQQDHAPTNCTGSQNADDAVSRLDSSERMNQTHMAHNEALGLSPAK